jgi:hypothetical protein
MVAIILFSAGGAMGIFMSFGLFSIFDLGILALPVTAFWLIFVAAKQPKLPEKTMISLKLFKVAIIVELVVVSLSALLMLIISIILLAVGSRLGAEVVFIGLILLLVAGGLVTFIIIYFKAVLQMLAGITNGIVYNSFAPFPGIKQFTLLTYILVGISVTGALVTIISVVAAQQLLWRILSEIPSEFRMFLNDLIFPNTVILTFQTLCTLATGAGIVMCILVLNQFNDKLISKAYGQQV